MNTYRAFAWIMTLAFGASSALADTSKDPSKHKTAARETRQAESRSDRERSTPRDTHWKLSVDQVKQLQQKLTARGFFHDEINGHFGPKTRRALREFQGSRKLEATGRMNQETANALGIKTGVAAAENPAKATAKSQKSPSKSPGREKSIELTALDKDQIRELQKKLHTIGYLDAEPNGELGPTTRSALEQYYRSQAALVADGRLGIHALSGFGIRPSEVKTAEQGGSETAAAAR